MARASPPSTSDLKSVRCSTPTLPPDMARSHEAKRWAEIRARLERARREARRCYKRAWIAVWACPMPMLRTRYCRYVWSLHALERALGCAEKYARSARYATVAQRRDKWYPH